MTLIGLYRDDRFGWSAIIERGRYSFIVPWIRDVHGDTDRGIYRLVDYDHRQFDVTDGRSRRG